MRVVKIRKIKCKKYEKFSRIKWPRDKQWKPERGRQTDVTDNSRNSYYYI